jgi:hypothetical protein
MKGSGGRGRGEEFLMLHEMESDRMIKMMG